MKILSRLMKSGSSTALALTVASAAAMSFFSTEAQAIPLGWTGVGSYGTSGADGVVTAPPSSTTYDWISTSGGVIMPGLALGGETNGSLLKSNVFAGNTGDSLKFYFNFITSDGAGFADYAWARLFNLTDSSITYLVTARTKPSGTIIPGFGMPAIDATLTPPSVPIIPGGPVWSPLGSSSGACYSSGCGYTGWVQSDFTLTALGIYQLEFGVVNWSDQAYDTGLAISGATINDTPIDNPVPEPATTALLGLGLMGFVMSRRKRMSSSKA